MTDEGENLAMYILAKEEARKLDDYLARGRGMQHLSDHELSERYVQLMTAWASSPVPAASPVGLNDVLSEASLRQLEMPSCPKQLEKIKEMVRQVRLEPEAYEDDVADYFKMRERPQ